MDFNLLVGFSVDSRETGSIKKFVKGKTRSPFTVGVNLHPLKKLEQNMERAVLMNNAAYKDYVPAVDKIKFGNIKTVTVYLFTK